MKMRLTSSTLKGTVHREVCSHADSEGIENQVVNLYPDTGFENFEGFGGAITDSAAYVYSLMNEDQKKELLNIYFSDRQMNYQMVRIHMDSCDFSTEMYEAVSDPDDVKLSSFSFERTEKYIIPMLRDAEKIAGRKLKIMLSPWSPPAFMKTNDSRKNGGSLKPEYADLWAEYICRYISEFRKREFEVQRISIQNEPKAVQTWDSCVYTAEQEKEFLEEHLYPALQRHGFDDTEVFIWDHNKERVFERVETIVEGAAAGMVTGAACHWYSGDHFEALDMVRHFYPDMKLIISESCIEYSKFDAKDQFANAARLSHEIIGDLNHGVTAFYDWNLLLDEKGGPNHVGNYCQAPFLYDTGSGTLIPQEISRHFNHFSHFIRPGSARIGFSRYTDSFDMTAYKNPDGKIVAVWLNRGNCEVPINVRIKGEVFKFVLEPESITTGCIE